MKVNDHPSSTNRSTSHLISLLIRLRHSNRLTGGCAFVTESSRVREEIQGFLHRESLLTLIAKKSLPTKSSSEEPGALSEGLAAASKTAACKEMGQ